MALINKKPISVCVNHGDLCGLCATSSLKCLLFTSSRHFDASVKSDQMMSISTRTSCFWFGAIQTQKNNRKERRRKKHNCNEAHEFEQHDRSSGRWCASRGPQPASMLALISSERRHHYSVPGLVCHQPRGEGFCVPAGSPWIPLTIHTWLFVQLNAATTTGGGGCAGRMRKTKGLVKAASPACSAAEPRPRLPCRTEWLTVGLQGREVLL